MSTLNIICAALLIAAAIMFVIALVDDHDDTAEAEAEARVTAAEDELFRAMRDGE